jgi:hypothetical protein
MIQAAQNEIRRLTRLHQGTELQLMLLTERSHLTLDDEGKLRELEQRMRQLQGRIEWFETILREHDSVESAAESDGAE